jgi:DNA processing protein
MSASTQLEVVCGEVVAPGTDPGVLARVLAWSVRPRRSPDALRRADRDRVAPGSCPSARVAAIAGAVQEDDAAAALPLVRDWATAGVQVALVGDLGYPSRVAEGWPDLDAPVWLAWRGAPDWQARAVAIVGARRASGYGTAVAAWLADAVARAGVRVVSGGALGIDAAAHRAALEQPGATTVVLGCGHAVGYPRPHATPGRLFDQIVAHDGAIVSESLPRQPPRGGTVRARNRIVAALADVVVVVEGGARSGSLLTAGAGAERGRTVLAVPGDVRAPGSAAPHRLLTEGVAPCTGPDDLLAALAEVAPMPPALAGDGQRVTSPAGPGPPSTLPSAARTVLARRWPRPVRLEDLATEAALPVPTLLAAVTRAAVAGEVVETVEGLRLRRAPSA